MCKRFLASPRVWSLLPHPHLNPPLEGEDLHWSCAAWLFRKNTEMSKHNNSTSANSNGNLIPSPSRGGLGWGWGWCGESVSACSSRAILRQPLQAGRVDLVFVVALLLSIVLHLFASTSLSFFLRHESAAAKPPIIRANLEILPPPVQPAPPPEVAVEPSAVAELAQNLRLKPQPPPKAAPPPPSPPPPDKPLARLAAAAQKQLAAMEQAGNLYPLEAIAEGQEGVVWVRIFFDEAGEVIAARLEEGSGYPLLDAAALRAVRSLTSLPTDGLESVILPVRFRLKKMR